MGDDGFNIVIFKASLLSPGSLGLTVTGTRKKIKGMSYDIFLSILLT